jgi:hypothetical protein
LLIRIDQKANKFPLFFHRAGLWIDFIQKKHPEPLVIAVNRHAYTTACQFFPKMHIHRLPDDHSGQLKKTLHLAQGHRSYCQFSSEPGILLSPGMIQEKFISIYFGPPGEGTVHSNLFVHGGIDASMQSYSCNSRTRLLMGPKYAFPLFPHPPEITKDTNKGRDVLLFLVEPLEEKIRNLIEASFRDLNISLKIHQPEHGQDWPHLHKYQRIISPAGLHFQELSSCMTGLISFAGASESLQHCYALNAAELADNLGWPPAYGRQTLSEKLKTLLNHSRSEPKKPGTFPPPFFEKLFNLIEDMTP